MIFEFKYILWFKLKILIFKEKGEIITKRSLIDKITESLNALNTKPYVLGLTLANQYKSESIKTSGVNTLKDIDNDRFQLLYQAEQLLQLDKQLSFNICDASLHVKYREFSSNYSNKVFWERKKLIHSFTWYDSTGGLLFIDNDVKVDFFDQIYNPNDQNSRPVELKSLDDWGGPITEQLFDNEYTKAEKIDKHVKTILVIWPKRFDFETKLRVDLTSSIDFLYKSAFGAHMIGNNYLPTNQETQSQLSILISFLAVHSRQEPAKRLSSVHLLKVAQLLHRYGQVNQIKEFFETINVQDINSAIVDQLFKTISKFNLDLLENSLKRFFHPCAKNLIRNCRIIEVKQNKTQFSLCWDFFD